MKNQSTISSGESDERAAFEASYRLIHPAVNIKTIFERVDDEDDRYALLRVQGAWEGWQARAALATQPAESKACASVGVEAISTWNNDKQSALNDWFLSLPEGRRDALLKGDRWALAGAAFEAALASPAPSVGEPTVWQIDDEHGGIAWQTSAPTEAHAASIARRNGKVTPLAPIATPPATPAATEAPSEPYAYEYGRDNGDGTYSVIMDKGALKQVGPHEWRHGPPRDPHPEHPVKALYLATPAPAVGASEPELRAAFEAWAAEEWGGKTPPHNAWLGFKGHASLSRAVGASVQPSDWLMIDGAPKDGRTLLLGYYNSAGKWRTLRGQWMSADYIAQNWEEPDEGEPGWYETVVESDDMPNAWRTNPTHYQLLPKEPGASVQPVLASLSDDERAELVRLRAIINTPQAGDFLRAVSTEAEHQRQRWGSDHDAGKTPADWFWLVGYLAGKALHAHAAGNTEKAEHHIITTGAACANWHLALFGKTDMRPGHEDGIDGDLASSTPSKGGEALATTSSAASEVKP